MHYLNEIFDKIYVLSYKSNINRHKYMNDLLKNREIDYELFFGADSGELGERLYDMGYPRRLSYNQICCSLSHYLLYLRIFELKQDNVLILEDDVFFRREEISKNEIEQIRNSEWDILYLGFTNVNVEFDNYMKNKLKKDSNLLKLNDYRYSAYDTFFEGTSSIVIRKHETLKILINELKIPEKLWVIDGIYNNLIADDVCTFLALCPQIFSQL